MENLIHLVGNALSRLRLEAQDRERCQMVYPVTRGSCYSERCGKKTEFECAECGKALCACCVHVVAFERYCQSCADEQEAFIAALIAGLKASGEGVA